MLLASFADMFARMLFVRGMAVRIRGKINLLVGLLSLVACIVGGMSVYAVNRYQDQTAKLEAVSDRARYGETLNRLVTAVVMESRGIYAAKDTSDAKRFADGLLKNLDTMSALLKTWKPNVPEGQSVQFSNLEKRFAEFRMFRTETARLGVEVGPEEANTQGNNEPNRENRKAYQAEIDAVVAADLEALVALKQEADNFGRFIFVLVTVVTIGGVVLGSVLGIYVGTKELSQPILRVSRVMNAVAEGDLEIEVPYLSRKDEIGEMAAAVEIFKQNGLSVRRMNEQEAVMRAKSDDLQSGMAEVVNAAAEGDFTLRIEKDYGDDNLNRFAANINALLVSVEEGVTETSRVVGALAEGDLTQRMSGNFRGIFGELKGNVNEAVERLTELMTQVRLTTVTISQNSNELRASAGDLSKRTEQQAAALEETSAALEEITSVVKNSTERATEATVMVSDAKEKTEASAKVVGDAVSAMGRIEQASGEIGQIINVIDEIAFQTNLLALNAGVEAARAGEAGKGFAVVAQEVRELAQRSANAAKDIKLLITRSGTEVERGVALVQQTGAVLQEIQERVVQIDGHINTIAQAAKEQSIGLSEVNIAVNQMDQVTQKNAAMVEESSAATHLLSGEADNLVSLIGRFTISDQPIVRPAIVKPHRPIAPVITPVPAVTAAVETKAPVKSPARKMLADVSRAFGNTAPSIGNWDEF
jgi:methyl-accepting chemotaxis protein